MSTPRFLNSSRPWFYLVGFAFIHAFLALHTYADDSTPEQTLASADLCFHFGEAQDTRLSPSPGVTLAQALEASAREESLQRGGDGLVARIPRGDWIAFDEQTNATLNSLTGREATFYVRVMADESTWLNAPFFSKSGGHENLSFNLYFLDDAVGAELGTTGNRSLLRCNAPVNDMLNPSEAKNVWHDVIFRVNNAKVALYVDGREYDEDFMIGQVRANPVDALLGAQVDSIDPDAEVRTGFQGMVDTLAIWTHALTDEEIVALCGGQERVDKRQITERVENDSMQYWTPPNNFGVGDCMPFYADGVFHFLYLLDKNRHGAKNGLGAHQWIQATSRDLKEWTHCPFVLAIDDQNEGSICTGSVFYHDGEYIAYYANRAVDYTTPDGQTHSTYGVLYQARSSDGIHFQKDERPLFLLPDGYGFGTRDPVVFQDPDDGTFHLFATTSYRGKGCWAHAVSPDLKTWTLVDPIYTHRLGEPECPDWFHWGDYYYVIANHLNGYYKRSKSPLGPYESPASPDVLMNGRVNVPKTAPFGDGRRIICGWTRERGFGGSAVFHELIQFPDGTLGEKFVPEMKPEILATMIKGGQEKLADAEYFELPEAFHLALTLKFDPQQIDHIRDFTVSYAKDRAIRVVFSERAVYLNDVKIERVDFTSGQINLEAFALGNIVDLCVNDSRTATFAEVDHEKFVLKLTNDAQDFVTVDFIEVSELK
ncbi:MAG: LamG-like jellyroll fold domain-containing protein [Planctomycetia bacterium]|nr:LamG-like jellyroll fold domain-containing protein [Planctomycetia bacterium]